MGSLPGSEDEKVVATQMVIWEIVTGCRNANAPYNQTDSKFYNSICANGTNGGVSAAYSQIVAGMQEHGTIPRVIEMSVATEGYSDLIKRIEDGFMEIDNDIIVDLRKQDDSYLALCRQIGDMERDYPFILNVTEGKGEISLTAEEHGILVEYFRLSLRKDNIERKQIYFRGHTDGYAYLRKIGAI